MLNLVKEVNKLEKKGDDVKREKDKERVRNLRNEEGHLSRDSSNAVDVVFTFNEPVEANEND